MAARGRPERRMGVLSRQLLPQAAPDALRHKPSEHSAAAPAVVIGGLVMDIQARPSGDGADVQRGGSVPGMVVQTPGGVSRNIAVGLAQHLGPELPPPLLVSCVGRDAAGDALVADLHERRLPLRGLLRPPKAATATVSIVFDRCGEVAAAVADVLALERALTPAALRSEFAHDVAAAPLVVADANLSPAALQEVCRMAAAARAPVWFEPVSAPKSTRATAVLRHLAFVSPNAAELVAMAAAACEAQGRPPPPPPHSPAPAQQPQPADDSLAALETPQPAQPHPQQIPAHPSQQPQPPQQRSPSQQAARGQQDAEGRQQDAEGRQHRQGGQDAARRHLRRLAPHIAVLLQAGVRHVVLTLGADGAALATLQQNGSSDDAASSQASARAGRQVCVDITHLPAEPATVATTSGAGDCLVGGAAAALLQGRPPAAALALGMAAAHVAVESPGNVPARCDAAAEAARAARLYARRQCWVETVLCRN